MKWKIFAKRRENNISINIFERKCSGCEKCVSVCNPKVLDMLRWDNVCFAEVTNQDNCIGCGKCVDVCESGAIELTDSIEIIYNYSYGQLQVQ